MHSASPPVLRKTARQKRDRRAAPLRVLRCTSLTLPPCTSCFARHAADPEQQRNLDFFLKHGVEASSWLTYRIVVASGPGILVRPLCLPTCRSCLAPAPSFRRPRRRRWGATKGPQALPFSDHVSVPPCSCRAGAPPPAAAARQCPIPGDQRLHHRGVGHPGRCGLQPGLHEWRAAGTSPPVRMPCRPSAAGFAKQRCNNRPPAALPCPRCSRVAAAGS